MPVNPDFRDLFAALNAAGARYLLVGGTAIDGVAFPEAWPDRAETTYGDQTVPVIGRRHLIQNKRAAGRPQDLLDLAVLESD